MTRLDAIDLARAPVEANWRDHVEQRLLTWRQSFVNRSGDQLALDDFMDKESLDDLIDFVCDEWAAPVGAGAAELPEPEAGLWELLEAVTIGMDKKSVPGEWLKVAWAAGSAFITAKRTAAELPEPVAENRELRRMLCIAHCGITAYMDDGEASDSSVLPFIDFLRDSLESIKANLHKRNLAQIAADLAAPLGAVAVDAAPQQNPDSVHQVGAPVGLSDAANPASPWVDAWERLPERDTPVLVYAPDNQFAKFVIDEWTTYCEDPTGLGGPTIDTGEGWGMHDFDHVTHWMPLPAPPALSIPDAGLAAPDGVIAGTTEWTKEGIPLPAPPAEATKEHS